MKDLNETLSQYSKSGNEGVTDAFDLLQEKVCYCSYYYCDGYSAILSLRPLHPRGGGGGAMGVLEENNVNSGRPNKGIGEYM